jgi:hypothetical protein
LSNENEVKNEILYHINVFLERFHWIDLVFFENLPLKVENDYTRRSICNF